MSCAVCGHPLGPRGFCRHCYDRAYRQRGVRPQPRRHRSAGRRPRTPGERQVLRWLQQAGDLLAAMAQDGVPIPPVRGEAIVAALRDLWQHQEADR